MMAKLLMAMIPAAIIIVASQTDGYDRGGPREKPMISVTGMVT